MPDTSAARAAIRLAYGKHRDVMGGMCLAMLKMEAAGGLLREEKLSYPEGARCGLITHWTAWKLR